MDNYEEPNKYVKVFYITLFVFGIFVILGSLGILQRGAELTSAILTFGLGVAFMLPGIRMRNASKRKVDKKLEADIREGKVEYSKRQSNLKRTQWIIMLLTAFLFLLGAIGTLKKGDTYHAVIGFLFAASLTAAAYGISKTDKRKSKAKIELEIREGKIERREEPSTSTKTLCIIMILGGFFMLLLAIGAIIKGKMFTTVTGLILTAALMIPAFKMLKGKTIISPNALDDEDKVKIRKKLDILEKTINGNERMHTLIIPFCISLGVVAGGFVRKVFVKNESMDINVIIGSSVSALISFAIMYPTARFFYKRSWNSKVKKAEELRRQLVTQDITIDNNIETSNKTSKQYDNSSTNIKSNASFQLIDLPRNYYEASTLNNSKCAFNKERDLYFVRRNGIDKIKYELISKGQKILLYVKEAINVKELNGNFRIIGTDFIITSMAIDENNSDKDITLTEDIKNIAKDALWFLSRNRLAPHESISVTFSENSN